MLSFPTIVFVNTGTVCNAGKSFAKRKSVLIIHSQMTGIKPNDKIRAGKNKFFAAFFSIGLKIACLEPNRKIRFQTVNSCCLFFYWKSYDYYYIVLKL